ncbi:MAG: hypothetical protein ABSG03_27885 [Bryobacteraceae bacterium]
MSVRRLLRKCLEKDPKRRLRDIGDAWELLEETAETRPARSRHSWIPWAATAAAVVALGISLWPPWRSSRPVEQPQVRPSNGRVAGHTRDLNRFLVAVPAAAKTRQEPLIVALNGTPRLKK